MKKINKLLTGISTAVVAISTPALALTSCASDTTSTNEIRSVKSFVHMIGTTDKAQLSYSLDAPLNEGETLTITHPSTKEFSFYEPVVKNTSVTLTVLKGEECYNGSFFSEQIEFVCKKNNEVVWRKNADCLVYYTSGVTLKDKKTSFTKENEITYTYTFELDEDPSKKNHYIAPYLVQDTTTSTEGLTISVTDTQLSGRELTIDVKLNTIKADFYLYDHADFSFEIYCLDSDSEVVWHASEKAMQLYYVTTIVTIPDAACTVDANNVLTAIDETALAGANTLDLTKGKLANVVEIADGLLDNSTNGKYDQIKALILNDECVKFGDNAFKNTKIKYINMSMMPDDAEWFYTGGFGTDSFSGLPSDGRIVFNDDWTAYKKHRMKVALYKAGLTNSNWYDVTEVSDAYELREALEMGGFIKLKNSFTIPATLTAAGIESGETKDWIEEIEVQRSSILDLNGFTIDCEAPVYYTTEEEEQTAMFAIWNGAELVVEDSSASAADPYSGTGTLIAYDGESSYEREGSTYCFNVHADNTSRYSPSLTITGGNFIGTRSVIHNNGAQVEIDGGSFHLTKKSVQKWNKHYSHSTEKNGCIYMLNCKGSSYKASECDFWVSAGRFYGWSFPDSTYGSLNYFDPSCSQDDYKEVGEEKVYANFLYDHDTKPKAADSDYEVTDHKAGATEEGSEGYLQVAKKSSI